MGWKEGVSHLLSIVFTIASAVLAGIMAPGAWALIPADIMQTAAPVAVVVTTVFAAALGGRWKPSHYDEDWEILLVFFAVIVTFTRYVVEMQGYLSGTALEVMSYVTFGIVALGFWVVGFRGT